MIFEPIITAVILALMLTLIFSLLLKNDGQGGFWIYFLVLFFIMWAGGLWLYPVGPYLWGVSWLPLFFIGLVAALLLSAAKSDSKKDSQKDDAHPPNPRDGEKKSIVSVSDRQHKEAIALSVFIWAVMIVSIIAIIAGYLINN